MTDTDVRSDGMTIQVTRTLTLDLHADPDSVFPLFGPVREAEWSPGWKPAFIVPVPGGQTSNGAVFTTGTDSAQVLWIMTDFDPARRTVRYVHVLPGRVASQLWIEVTPAGAHGAHADITFRNTAIGPAGRDQIARFIQEFPMFQHHWEHAVGAALSPGSPAKPSHY